MNVHCGKNHAALISKKGEIYMIGDNQHGQLGVENKSMNSDKPAKI